MLLKLLTFFIDLIIPIAIGYLLKRSGRLSERAGTRMMMWNLYTLATLLGGLSVWGLYLKGELIWLPFLGVAMQLVAVGCGMLRVKRAFDDPLEKGSYLLSCMLSNRGTVGVLTIFVLAGEKGYALCMMIMLLARFVVQLIGFPMSEYFMRQGHETPGPKPSLFRLFFTTKQLPLLGILTGLCLNVFHIQRPEIISHYFSWLVHPMAWFFMIPIGQGLDFTEMGAYWRRVLDLLAIKFLITPLIIAGIAWLLPLDPLAWRIVVILSFSPTAINAVITARIHHLNMHLSMAAFMLTTLVYMVVCLPLFILVW